MTMLTTQVIVIVAIFAILVGWARVMLAHLPRQRWLKDVHHHHYS